MGASPAYEAIAVASQLKRAEQNRPLCALIKHTTRLDVKLVQLGALLDEKFDHREMTLLDCHVQSGAPSHLHDDAEPKLGNVLCGWSRAAQARRTGAGLRPPAACSVLLGTHRLDGIYVCTVL